MADIYVDRAADGQITVKVYRGISKPRTWLFPTRQEAERFAEDKLGRQEAWRRDVMAAGYGTYTETVRIALHDRGLNPLISLFERGAIEAGYRNGSSPLDVADVIEVARDAEADAAYEAARFWEDVELTPKSP